MTSKEIEDQAVQAVQGSISETDYLYQYIKSDDKEPTWDGFVYIYDDTRKRKQDDLRRVAVQVKGVVKEKIDLERITYSVNTVDLKNILSDGGAVYFVVYISPDKSRKKIYYAQLTPVKLIICLEGSEGQKTKSIEFTPFPDDNIVKSTIFLNFHDQCKRQASFNSSQLLKFPANYNDITEISFPVTGYGYSDRDIERAFLENEIYMYGKRGNVDIPIPFKMITKDLQILNDESIAISVNGKEFYHAIKRIRTHNNTKIKIGKSLTISFDIATGSSTVNYKAAKSLKDRILDSDFILTALKNNGFFLGKLLFPLLPEIEALENFDIKQHELELQYSRKLQQLLETLNVDKDLNVEELSTRDILELNNLICAFIDKEPVSNLRDDIDYIMKISIQEIMLLLIFEKDNEVKGQYRIKNFFDTNLVIDYSRKDEREKRVTSQFTILKPDDYNQLDNIDYDRILPSYQALASENPKIFEMASNDMLKILIAFDESGNTKLLDLAEEFAKWILYNDKDTQGKILNVINMYQVYRRKRRLLPEEMKELVSITENSEQSVSARVGAYLLLDNQAAAQVHFQKLNHDEQKEFKQCPIFRFWKTME